MLVVSKYKEFKENLFFFISKVFVYMYRSIKEMCIFMGNGGGIFFLFISVWI